ncbi:hypothetical protein [Acidovorax sp. JG5]|uniref:hypothetical protein n=1 Tax=Acidovorax sp. JG5 TaxID=2822718 RepID=UPI0032BFED0E
MSDTPTINGARLMQRIAELGQFGALPGGGTNRLALSDADRAARDWTVQQMRTLDMDVEIDAIGNVFATYAGTADLPPRGHWQPHRHRAHRRPVRRQLWRAGGAGSGGHAA